MLSFVDGAYEKERCITIECGSASNHDIRPTEPWRGSGILTIAVMLVRCQLQAALATADLRCHRDVNLFHQRPAEHTRRFHSSRISSSTVHLRQCTTSHFQLLPAAVINELQAVSKSSGHLKTRSY